MGWRFVKQPNGLLARFSEVVDDFTEYDMSVSDCLDYCKPLMGTLDASAKIDRALGDHIDWEVSERHHDGLDRWRDAIETVRLIHGDAVADQRVKELSKPPESTPCP